MQKTYFTPRTKMADMIARNHTLILVTPRFGIPLGFGERSVQEICDTYHISVRFVLTVCNIYTFDDYQPDNGQLQTEDLRMLVPYLQASHRYYQGERLPHIERHLVNVAEHAGDRYGTILRQFFTDYRSEVCDHFDCEERELFPRLQRLEQGLDGGEGDTSSHFADNHSDLVDKLGDLTQIVYKYLPGESITEELNELVFAVMQLSSDLEKHAAIEEKILLPYLDRLERRNA